ncbi:hypothetical protein AB0M05_34060 [Streptomyces violaceusniger]|uniref:hypothetical protein n=1 Tax=Streptomyces violaceusniger TaxID=68280 RepID=UPI00341D8356
MAGRTARQYRRTARMCTPPLREFLASSGVHVSYSTVREGGRMAPSGKPYDEDFNMLRTMVNEAAQAGAGRVSGEKYRRALGLGPNLQDLMEPSGGTSVSDYLGTLLKENPVERDKVLRELMEEDTNFHGAVKRAMEDKRRRDRETRGLASGGPTDKAHDIARELVRLNDQVTTFVRRFPPTVEVDFTAEQRAACEQVLGTVEVLATWIRVKVIDRVPAASREHAMDRNLVAV